MTNYKRLDVWLQAMQLVKEVYTIAKKYPQDELYGLISQTKRAVISIPANIAEGLGRHHWKETVQFFHIARGSAYETEALLEVAVAVEILQENEMGLISEQLQKCLQLINGMIRHYERKNIK